MFQESTLFENDINKMSYFYYKKIGTYGVVTENHELQLFASILLIIFTKND